MNSTLFLAVLGAFFVGVALTAAFFWVHAPALPTDEGLDLSERPDHVMLAARAAHEVNRAYCASIGDASQLPWDEAPQWQKDSAVSGVHGVLRGNGPGASHVSWLADKERDGWVYGPVKDPERKTHPCMVPFAELPPEQQVKDVLFVNTVLAVLSSLASGE